MDTLENGSANGREGVCLLRMREIMDRTTLSRPVLGRMIKDKLFPSGCRNGREHPRWSDRDVTAWQVSRMDARAGVLRLAEPVTLQPRKGMEPGNCSPPCVRL